MILNNKKGISEVISYLLITVIIVSIVAIIYVGFMPTIKETESYKNYQTAQGYMTQISNKIDVLLQSPVNSVVSLSLDLSNLILEIDSNTQKIEFIFRFYGDFFEHGVYKKEGNIYTYRDSEKMVVGLDLMEVEFSEDLFLEKVITNIYIKKIDRNKIMFSRTLDSGDIIVSDISNRPRPEIS